MIVGCPIIAAGAGWRLSTGIPAAASPRRSPGARQCWRGRGRISTSAGHRRGHSRLLVDYQCVHHDAARFMTLFRHAIATHRIPSIPYVDNASALIDEAAVHLCGLGIRVTHSTSVSRRRRQGRTMFEAVRR
jgi:hypothetical protein